MTVTNRQPAFFISHGSPMLAIDNSETAHFLAQLGRTTERPDAILVFSAHLDSASDIFITFGSKPSLIYDFYGFPAPLYDIRYPAPGHPQLAADIAARLDEGGFTTVMDEHLGWDHGVWIPLNLMYPEADIPVVQVSISSRSGPKVNHLIGELLSPLRDEGVMIIGSGGSSHNLKELFNPNPSANSREKVHAFTSWVTAQLNGQNRTALLNYLTEAPYVLFNHPTQEHFMPLFNVLGSSKNMQVEHLHDAVHNEILALDAYRFD